MVELAEAMSATPDDLLHRLSSAALQLCHAQSAGFSLLDSERRRFRWCAVVGAWAGHAGGGTPRDFGPCGTVLDQGVPLLFFRPERQFPYLASVNPPIDEGLLLPFGVDGEAVGTLWIIGHDSQCRFDAEDLRVMTNLGRFAAIVYQDRGHRNALARANEEMGQTVQALRVTRSISDRLRIEKKYLEEELRAEGNFHEFIGDSDGLTSTLRQVELVAATSTSVLVLGETGTGKELVARAIHNRSSRYNAPFIRVNCAAIPAGLLESELFGHQKGAFTGADSQKMGRLEIADQGTLFLDEIGDLPLDLQPKLLRVLEEQEFERLGSSRTIRVNARVIAATNRNLPQMVADGRFRDDLYYRLNVFPITVPPLRERSGDIPALVRYFVEKHATRMGRPVPIVPPAVTDAFQRWHWPGNIRELSNVLERAVILTCGPALHIPLAGWTAPVQLGPTEGTLEAIERDAIVRALRSSGGRVGGLSGAAARLGLKRTTLNARMRRLGLSRQDLK